MKENSCSFLPPLYFTFTRYSVIDNNGKHETETLAKEYGVLVLAFPSIPVLPRWFDVHISTYY
jgi:hypothetical protein